MGHHSGAANHLVQTSGTVTRERTTMDEGIITSHTSHLGYLIEGTTPTDMITEATELQLQLPPCPPTIAPPRKENLDRYCDYHGEKGHYTNDCYHLKRQLEVALESGKLNHLVKDVRQRGNNRGRPSGNNNGGRGRVINMIREGDMNRKRKSRRNQAKEWINVPITFPHVPVDDVLDDPLII
ncbi:hypothetical protein Tco_1263154 [Tanacetum coccineum]